MKIYETKCSPNVMIHKAALITDCLSTNIVILINDKDSWNLVGCEYMLYGSINSPNYFRNPLPISVKRAEMIMKLYYGSENGIGICNK